MKQYILFLFTFILSVKAQAQEKIRLEQGNTLVYQISVQGKVFPIFMSLDSISKERWIIGWNYENGRSGKFITTKKSLDNATMGYFNPPIDGEELTLPEDQAILLFSRTAFSNLKNNKQTSYNEENYFLKEATGSKAFKMQGKIVDAIYAENESRNCGIWILNHMDYPVILKIAGNKMGVDAILVNIE